MRSPSFYIPFYRKFWETVSVNEDVEVITLGVNLKSSGTNESLRLDREVLLDKSGMR